MILFNKSFHFVDSIPYGVNTIQPKSLIVSI